MIYNRSNGIIAIRKRNIFGILAYSLLALMMIFDAQMYIIKVFILTLLLLLLPHKLKLSKSVISLVGLLVMYGCWGIFIGVLKNNDSPFHSITTTMIWPILFTLYISQINREYYFRTLLKVTFCIHTLIILYDLIFAFSIIAGFYFPNIYSNYENGFAMYETTSRLTFGNLNTLTFTVPVFYILFVTKFNLGISRIVQFLILIASLFLFILSGRRSVMLLFFLLPIISLFLMPFLPKMAKNSMIKILLIVILFIIISIAYTFTFYPELVNGYWDTLIKAFDSDREPTKFAQQKMLLSHFYSSPICGEGFGRMFYEPFPGRMRWGMQFELQYHLSLAQTGVVGFMLIMLSYLGTLFYSIYLAYKCEDLILFAFAVGLFFILILNATNPILGSFDWMLPLYFCWAKINTTDLILRNNE